MRQSLRRAGWTLALLLFVPGVAPRAELADSSAAPVCESPADQELPSAPPLDREALLARLDLAQQQLDDARRRSRSMGSFSESEAILSSAQKTLDQARARLLGQESSLSSEMLLRQLRDAQVQLASTRNRLNPTSSAERALLDQSRERLEAARAWLEGAADARPPAPPGRDEMQAMFDRALQVLGEAREKILSAEHPDPRALQQLEEAEQRLEKARQDSVALGLLD